MQYLNQSDNNERMEQMGGAIQQKGQKHGDKIYGVYIKSVLTQKVILHITEIGRNTKQNLEKKLISKNEGKCIPQGFIRPGSVNILTYTSGIVNTEYIEFNVLFECMVCHPVEGMLIECVTKMITKAGIHAEVITDDNVVPATVFLARDHHHINEYFNSIKENMQILVNVIGIRFELNDPVIAVVAELVKPRNK
jgi:DNA-directed RNA polymerase subunit E'/Rpb7